MHSMKHNRKGIYAFPKHKHVAIQENKHQEKQTKQSFLIKPMSSPLWYMHLPYGISPPLQMCMRNRISPPKDVHKSYIEMTKTLRYTLPFFVKNRQRVKEKKRARDDRTNNANDAWGVQDEWENEAQS